MRMIVLPVLAAEAGADASYSSVYRDVLGVASDFANLRVLTDEELFAREQQRMGQRLKECGSDPACITAQLESYDAQLCLVVAVNELMSPPFLAVRLLDVRRRSVVGSADGQLLPEEGSVSAAIRRRANAVLVERGFARAGRIEVDVTPTVANVMLEPSTEPQIGTSRSFRVAPGRYRLRASADGHEPGSVEVTVAAGETVRVPIALTEEGSLIASPWLWIGVGVVAAAAGVGVAVAASRSGPACVCAAPEGTPCPPCP